MAQHENPEAGLRNHRTGFARESNLGDLPSGPSFLKYSDTIAEVSWSSDAINEERRGIGDPDPVGFIRGPESHEVTVSYDLVKWFTDGSGNPEDAAYDGMVRDADNLLPNSHTFVDREDKTTINAENTLNGSTSRGTRIYTVARGGLVDEVSVSGDPSDSQPVGIELSYVFQKVRSYQFDQPNGDLLAVKSTDANDTSQSVTIESEGASTTETISLSGTSLVSTSSSYNDLDAVELDAETKGDLEVYINTGSTTTPAAGDKLAVLQGSDSYATIEGDLGVPVLTGSGTRESTGSLGDPETFIGDVINRSATPVPHEVQSATLTVSNNVATTEQSDQFGMHLAPGNRNLSFDLSMYGEVTSHGLLRDHLTNTAYDRSWELTGGTLSLAGTVLTDPGDRAAEEGQAVMTVDNTFTATGITIS